MSDEQKEPESVGGVGLRPLVRRCAESGGWFIVECRYNPGQIGECKPVIRGRGVSVWWRIDGEPSWEFLMEMEDPQPLSKILPHVEILEFFPA